MKATEFELSNELHAAVRAVIGDRFPHIRVRMNCVIDIPVKQMIERVCRVLEQDYESVMHDPTVGRPDTGVYTARYVVTKILRDWYEYDWCQISDVLTLANSTVRRQLIKANDLLSCGDDIMTEAYNKSINNLLYES